MATVPGVFLGHKSSKEVWHNVVMVNQSLSHFGWQNLKDKHYFRSREDVPNYLRAWAGFPAAWVIPGLRCVYTARGHVCRGSMAGWGSGRLGMWGLATAPHSPPPPHHLLSREVRQLNQRRRQPPGALWSLQGLRLGREVPATGPSRSACKVAGSWAPGICGSAVLTSGQPKPPPPSLLRFPHLHAAEARIGLGTHHRRGVTTVSRGSLALSSWLAAFSELRNLHSFAALVWHW